MMRNSVRGIGSLLPSRAVSPATAVYVCKRWKKDNELKGVEVTKSTRDIYRPEGHKIFTMAEYIEKHEEEYRGTKIVAESVTTENPFWMLWGMALVGVTVAFVIVCARIRRERARFDPELRTVKQLDSPEGPSIGGPFNLVDVNGKRYTEKDFLGKWTYIYFGFSNCPDVCPAEMYKMTRLIGHLDKKVGKDFWQPIFITIDPTRDTAPVMKEYLSEFSPRILGLRGTPEEVESAARQYRVYYAVPTESEGNEDYLIDHSIIMYLMDPDGKFCDYTTKEFTWHESYSKIMRRMMDFEQKKLAAKGVEQKNMLDDDGNVVKA